MIRVKALFQQQQKELSKDGVRPNKAPHKMEETEVSQPPVASVKATDPEWELDLTWSRGQGDFKIS